MADVLAKGSTAMQPKRRTFLLNVASAATALLVLRPAHGAASEQVSEADPQAQALGYKADATKVDKVKFPKFAAGQTCSSCQLYQGKAGDTAGPCPLFQNKLVAAAGWCSAWVKNGK